MANTNEKPTRILSRDGSTVGVIKNLKSRPCPMEGCTGVRIHVVWPNGRHTYPCSKAVRTVDKDTLQIT